MRSSRSNSSDKGRDVEPEIFALFLRCLSEDAGEASRRYTRLHEKLVGFFSLKGVSDPFSAADETIDRALIRLKDGAVVPDVGKYCLGIARNIAKEEFRRGQRETEAFLHFTENLQNTSDEELERIYMVLKPCFEQLSAQDQQLLLAYCRVLRGRARAEHRRQLAETMMTTVLALRMRVTRLRGSLMDCVRKRSEAL